MKKYNLTYRRSVDKDLRAIPTAHRKVMVIRIQALADNPKPPGSIKLKGSKDLYRFRYTEYRVIYQINEKAINILIIKVGHRKEVYKGF